MSREKKEKKKKRQAGRIILIAVLVLIVLFIIYIIMSVRKASELLSQSEAIAEEYVMHDLSQYISTDGVVVSENVESVTTTLTYPVKEIYVEVGDTVKKGDVIAEIDSTEIDKLISRLEEQATDQELSQAKQLEISSRSITNATNSQNAANRSANRAVATAKASYDNAVAERSRLVSAYDAAVAAENAAKAEYDAAINLKTASPTDASLDSALEDAAARLEAASLAAEAAKAAMDALPQSAVDELKSAYEATLDQYDQTVEAGKEGVQSARDQYELQNISANSYSELASQLAEAYEMKADTVIFAGQDGIVTVINAVEGMPVQGVIMQIEDDKNLRIEISVKEKSILDISEGQDVIITSDNLDSIDARGVVETVYRFKANISDAMMTGGVSTYTAIVDVTNPGGLMLGMSVKTKVVVAERGDVMSVAYTSIFEEDGQSYVYVASPTETAGFCVIEKRAVTTGEDGDYYTEILSGLEAHDKVISFPENYTEGAVVHVNVRGNSAEN